MLLYPYSPWKKKCKMYIELKAFKGTIYPPLADKSCLYGKNQNRLNMFEAMARSQAAGGRAYKMQYGYIKPQKENNNRCSRRLGTPRACHPPGQRPGL
jgi:hypothetical protein